MRKKWIMPMLATLLFFIGYSFVNAASATIYGETVTGVSKGGTLESFASNKIAGTVKINNAKIDLATIASSQYTIDTHGNSNLVYLDNGDTDETRAIFYKGPNGRGIPAGAEGYITNSGISKTASESARSKITIIFKNAVTMPDGSTRDLSYTISNIYIDNKRNDTVTLFYGWSGFRLAVTANDASGNHLPTSGAGPNGIGMRCDVTLSVLNTNGTPVTGESMVVEFVDLDVRDVTRSGGSNQEEYYPKMQDSRYSDTYNKLSAYDTDYREGVLVLSGALSDAYMPSTNWLEVKRITSGTNANGLRFSSYGGNKDAETLDSGFMLLADASEFKFRWYGSNRTGMATCIVTGVANHSIKATSGTGGLARTDFSFSTANPLVNTKNSSTGSFQHNFSDGSNVNYIMAADTNYKLGTLTVDTVSFTESDFSSVAAGASNSSVNVTKSGTTYSFKVSKNAKGNVTGVTYTFSNIQVNHNISVTWSKIPAKVIVKHVDGSGRELATSETKNGNAGDAYTTSAKTITNYKVKTTPSNANGTMTVNDITVTYVYELKPAKLIVNRIDRETRANIRDRQGNEIKPVTTDKKYTDTYTTEATQYYGYNLVVTPSNASGTISQDVVTVTYEYSRKDTSVVAKHIDLKTGLEIAEQVKTNYKVFDQYTTSKKEIDGYDFISVDKAETGETTEDQIVVTYGYKKRTKVTVKHQDIFLKDTSDLLDTKTYETGIYVGDTYEGLSKDFEGYMLNRDEPTSKEITLQDDENENVILFYYRYESAGVIEKHVDYISKKIIDEDLHDGLEGESYGPIDAKDYDDYVLLERMLPEPDANGKKYNIDPAPYAGTAVIINQLPVNTSGKFTIAIQEVRYYYIHEGKVTVKYIDEYTGNEIATSLEIEGLEEDPYKTESKTIDGYDLVEERLPENAEGKMTAEEIEVIYYYKRQAKVKVEYIDKDTGDVLDNAEINGHIGDDYQTEKKEIEGYDIIEEEIPENAEGKMLEVETKVKYYYKKKTKVNVKYIDKDTGEVIEIEEIEGHPGDEYKTEEKEIEEYELIEDELPDNTEGEMTREEIDVVYYYRKKAKVIVKYIDKGTGKELSDEITIEGYRNDEYETEEKTFEGYKLIGVPENAKGTMAGGKEEVIYYYENVASNPKTLDSSKKWFIAIIGSILGVIGSIQFKKRKHNQ